MTRASDPTYQAELRAAALAYAERGWLTIELRPDTTTPICRGWPESATADVERILRLRGARPASAIGLPMGWQAHGRYHLALDEDRPGVLAELAAQRGQTLPPTWRQLTRRGQHHVYALAREHEHLDDLALRNRVAIVSGLDVRAQGGYVVGAPSMHRDGEHRYTVIDDRDPVDLPRWLLLAIAERSRPTIHVDDSPGLDDAAIERDYPYALRLRRARLLCEQHDPAISGDDGSGTTMRLVGSIVTGLALRRDDARALLLDVYSPRCVPPWSLAEINHMLANAITRPRRPRGYLLVDRAEGASADATGRGGQPRVVRPPTVRAEIVGVDERHGAVWYAIADGPHAGQTRRRPMAWPPSPQSERLWSALATALGLDQITRPHAQCWQRTVRVEIVDDATYSWCIGRVYPDDDGTDAQPSEVTP